LLIVTGGCLLAFTQEYRASAAMARPSRLLLTATAVVSLLAVSLPYAGAVAQAFGFLPLPLPLLIATFLIVLLYVVATEFTKLWFYGWLMRARVDGARTSAAEDAS